MKIETIILIITNIIVPIIVALITGGMQAKKYRKEIQLINAEHENRISEINNEYAHRIDELNKEYAHRIYELNKEHAHEIEMLKMQIKSQQELEAQRAGNTLVEKLTEKLSDEIIKQPATQKMITQKTAQRFSGKKRR